MIGLPRRGLSLMLLLTVFFVIVMLVTSTGPKTQEWPIQSDRIDYSKGSSSVDNDLDNWVKPSLLTGHAIAPKLGNETAKAELGRASWKLFHTILARFPDTPTTDESDALKSYIHLFQRLYPCGECAQHFGEILKKFPPQTSSRSVAATWGCHVHNQVNKSLKKDIFDCNNIGEFYKCGCTDGDDDSSKSSSSTSATATDKLELARAVASASSILAIVTPI